MYSLQLPSKSLISFIPTNKAGSAITPRTVLLSINLALPIDNPGGSCPSRVANPSAGTHQISTTTETPLVAFAGTRTIAGCTSLIEYNLYSGIVLSSLMNEDPSSPVNSCSCFCPPPWGG